MDLRAPLRTVPCVLLAEDDDALRGQIARSIREMGWSVREARDGRELLLLVDALGPSVGQSYLVTDLRMPALDGCDVLAELRGRAERPCTIVISAFADDHVRGTLSSLGASLFFEKPFDVDDLCTALYFLHQVKRSC